MSRHRTRAPSERSESAKRSESAHRGSAPPGGGRLFIVATPIGNLEDITLRALRVLREADVVLAEDTRRTRVLMNHYEIRTKVEAFHAHSPPSRVAHFTERLRSGLRLALVSDAGTPLISDPGARLVSAAMELGVPAEVIPGPSAPIAAVAASGLSVTAGFRFIGFLPRSGRERLEAIARMAQDPLATVFFESPRRLPATLHDLQRTLGAERRATVCRELSKLHEEIQRGTLTALAERFADDVRGEITVVVEGASPEAVREEQALARAAELLADGTSARDAARLLAIETGWTRRDAYRLILEAERAGSEP